MQKMRFNSLKKFSINKMNYNGSHYINFRSIMQYEITCEIIVVGVLLLNVYH